MNRYKCQNKNNINNDLINIIKPYMDKKISQGCFFKEREWNWEIHMISSICYYQDILENINYLDNGVVYWINIDIFNSEYEILWHYNINAVINFILDKLELDFMDWYVTLNVSLSWNYILNSNYEWYNEIKWITFPNESLIHYNDREINELIKNLNIIEDFSKKKLEKDIDKII